MTRFPDLPKPPDPIEPLKQALTVAQDANKQIQELDKARTEADRVFKEIDRSMKQLLTRISGR